MKKITLFIVLSGLWIFNCLAQNIESYFESQKTVSYQKLYLHTDRELYFESDTLWFTAYLVDGHSHVISPDACNLYVDIINDKGAIVREELFIIQNGRGSGNIPIIPNYIEEGKYLIRAYTDYLKNFGHDAFFTKSILVSSIKNSFELTDAQKNISKRKKEKQDLKTGFANDKIDVLFLPEAGFLLAEESNCISFKAIDHAGKGVDVSGKLFDEENNLILSFQTKYKGAGKFYFYPKARTKYFAKIDGWADHVYQLPEIKETGAKIKLISQEINKLQMLVQGKDVNQNLPYYLACMHRGKGLFFMEVNQRNINTVLKIETSQLRGGINRFVLLDKNLTPVSERLIFQNDLDINYLQVRPGDNAYSTREEVQVNIKSLLNTENERAHVSISVVDENYINATGISQNIASYLLLDSELKGYIDSPADYLVSDKKLDAQTKLDLLMSTNGWSNYKWNLLYPESVSFDFEPKLGFDFKGNVKRTFGKKALSDGSVFFLIKNKRVTQLIDQPLDNQGKFEFTKVVFFDSASVFAQARNKKNNHNIQFEITFPKITPPIIDVSILNQLKNYPDIPLSVFRQRYLNDMKTKEFYPDKNNILIDEVNVKGENYLERWKTGVERKNNGPYLLTPEKIAGTSNIIEYLAYNIPGVFPSKGGQSITLLGGAGTSRFDAPEPLILIDYSLTLTVEDAKSYSPDMFETMELLTPPMSYFYRAPGGVVLLTTKTGRSLNETDIPLLGGLVKRIKGFSPMREFYTPKYNPKNINSKAPDFRNTLYWNPQLTLENGENEIYFNTCDNISAYKIFVEGISESGRICLGEAEFKVNNFRSSAEKQGKVELVSPNSSTQ
jgi:hypothetical protein